MASTAYNNIFKLTPDNQGIRDINELVFFEALKASGLSDLVDMNYGLFSGKVLGGIGEFDLVGTSQQMCNPKYNTTKLNTAQKIWELGNITIAETLCADDFEETIAKWCMNKGTNRADMTDTEIVLDIIVPRLVEATLKALMRVIWLGDKSAKNVADSGFITDGFDTAFFTIADGLFKRLYDFTASAPERRTIITSNAKSTKEEQVSDLRSKGVATGIFDSLIYDSNPILRQDSNRFILATQSLTDALAIDLKQTNIGSNLQWESLFGGLAEATVYNGERIVKIPMWDEMIRTMEYNGTTWRDPHRAIFCRKENLLAGFEALDAMPELDMHYSKDTRTNMIYARNMVGTLLWQEELIQYAY